MSSHHFVKEDQEPALVLLSVADNTFEKIQPLLEWSPRVIVHGGLLSIISDWGIKIDTIATAYSKEKELLGKVIGFGPLDWIYYENDFFNPLVDYLATKKISSAQFIDAHGIIAFERLEKLSDGLTISLLRNETSIVFL